MTADKIDSILITARQDAIDGLMSWQMPVMTKPALTDMISQGHALIRYDGNRDPKRGRCAGCGKPTTFAWHIHPINFIVPGCNPDHVADRVEEIWSGDRAETNFYIRVRGDKAKSMVGAAA